MYLYKTFDSGSKSASQHRTGIAPLALLTSWWQGAEFNWFWVLNWIELTIRINLLIELKLNWNLMKKQQIELKLKWNSVNGDKIEMKLNWIAPFSGSRPHSWLRDIYSENSPYFFKLTILEIELNLKWDPSFGQQFELKLNWNRARSVVIELNLNWIELRA